ncbi:tetraacyldisaccharide 4'-kinase [Desulfoferrobacter suflitae]|uniref:tetraacyldisaccharide 4'-kinase n=1 Tax=Desulfoferrobacter suflitae TaxID=2865782 RepID=UPI002164841E|nr:tetraacyldisaccharide 4'-kinase [Desulfoferrobacter suflitae]MCK8603885.1 tetraacyldisaccharide 4'-kinase [Desulfoferrobacter suflitae]
MGTRLGCAVTDRLLRFWYQQAPSPVEKRRAGLLSFSSSLYRYFLQRDQQKALRRQRRLPVRVISVGNLVVGGTGKTPFTLWLAQYVQSLGKRVAILSRGYGRGSHAARQAPVKASADWQVNAFGDEPILLAQKLPHVPVWVGRDRWQAGKCLMDKHAVQVIILDDGFQHLLLHRDLDFVLLDTQNPFGNGHLLPLGPLREPTAHLQRADAIIATRADDPQSTQRALAAIGQAFPDKAIFSCRHHLAGFRFGLAGPAIPLDKLQSTPSVAFAGIARPESFFASLQELDIPLVERVAFPDHYPYRPDDLLRLLRSRSRHRAQLLITTQKDAARLPHEFREQLATAELQLDFGSDTARLTRYLKNWLSG